MYFYRKLHLLRACPRENQTNQAGGDTAQITDFAQTELKCWLWGVNDGAKNSGSEYFIPLVRAMNKVLKKKPHKMFGTSIFFLCWRIVYIELFDSWPVHERPLKH